MSFENQYIQGPKTHFDGKRYASCSSYFIDGQKIPRNVENGKHLRLNFGYKLFSGKF